MTDPTWRVVGGAKGGILVREGQDLKSPEAPSRLSKGAILREVELHGERLRYELLSGDGPPTGWVSLTLKGANLLKKHGEVPKQVDLGMSTIPAPAEAKGRTIWILSSSRRDDVMAFTALGAAAKKAGYRVRLFTERKWQALATAVGLDFTEAGLSDEDIGQGIGTEPDAWLPEQLVSFRHAARAACQGSEAASPDLVLYVATFMSVAMALHDWHGITTYPVWFRLPDPSILTHLLFLDEVMPSVAGYAPIRTTSPEETCASILAPRVLLATTSLELEAIADEGAKQQYLFTHKSFFTGHWTIPENGQHQLSDPLGFGGVRGDVEAFLKAGKPPVYVSWGESTIEGAWATGMIVAAMKADGFRAIVISGKSDLSEEKLRAHVGDNDAEGLVAYAKANVLFTPAVAPDWVLPKCCCAMVVGGHGVVGSCLHAGLPVLVSPLEGDDHHHADFVMSVGLGRRTTDIMWLEQNELRESLKFIATDGGIANKIKEVQKQLNSELGVAAALLGVNAVMKNEVISGATRREWLEKKRIAEEAAETDEEPHDGVLRPPPETAAKKPVAQKETISTPEWLKPDGKGKILIFTIPLKGHIIHLIRTAQWFLERPGYEVTVVCSEQSVPDIPKGANIITYKHTDTFSMIDEMLAKQAHLEEDEQAETERPPVDTSDDAMLDMLKKIIAPVVDLKPDIFLTDHGLNFFPTANFIPALCKVYKAKCIFVVSPSIKENRIRQYKAQAKLANSSSQKPKKPPPEPAPVTDDKKEGQDDSPEKAMFAPDENGVPNIPFKPDNMSMMKFMQVLRAMPSINAEPPLHFYPSSQVLYKATRYDNELFAGAFLPLPQPVDGKVQHGRADLQDAMKAELLDWLFASEDPVVYVAFGTIVSKFLPSVFVARLVEALGDGAWRVLLVLPESLQKHLPKGLAGPRWYIESFAPQAAILRCERVGCFVSHCGANSTMEAMACGVPLVCMPFYMDQFDWSWAVRRHCRAAVQISCHSEAAAIRTAVTEVLTDTAYRDNARRVALRMASQADAVLEKLGPDMQPKARLGPGVSVLAAVILGLVKGQDVQPIFKLVDQSLPA